MFCVSLSFDEWTEHDNMVTADLNCDRIMYLWCIYFKCVSLWLRWDVFWFWPLKMWNLLDYSTWMQKAHSSYWIPHVCWILLLSAWKFWLNRASCFMVSLSGFAISTICWGQFLVYLWPHLDLFGIVGAPMDVLVHVLLMKFRTIFFKFHQNILVYIFLVSIWSQKNAHTKTAQ